jgi:hypothetical protein
MRLSKEQIAWWNEAKELRFFTKARNWETEPWVAPMTVRRSGREANISDFMRAFRAALLIAATKSPAKKNALESVYDSLQRDMREEPNYIRHVKTKSANSSFSTQIGMFTKCAPFFKAFFENCTEKSMRYLLIKTRLFFATNPEWARQCHRLQTRSKRKSKVSMPGTFKTSAELKDRLWPLPNDVYEGFVCLYIRKRLGPKGGCFALSSHSDYGIKVRLTRHGCELINCDYNDDKNWGIVTRKGAATQGLELSSPIVNFAKIERMLAVKKPLRIYGGKIVVP